MTTTRIRTRRTVATAFAFATATVLALALPSTAVADPPALNRDACSTTLAQAALWPGGMGTGTSTVRFFSDGYDSHLAARPECVSPGS